MKKMKKSTKKNTLFRIGIFISIVAVAAVAVCFATGATETLSHLFAWLVPSGGGGLVLANLPAGVAVPETPTAASLEDAGLVEQDLSKDITVMNPDRFPLDTMTRNYLRKRSKALTQKPEYLQKSTKPMRDSLDAAAAGNGVSSAAPCSQFTAAAGSQATKVYIKPLNVEIWRTHDTLLMRGLTLDGSKDNAVIGAAGSFTDDVVFYITKKEGEYLEMTPINGMLGTGVNAKNFIVPTFTATTVLYRMGQAKSELSMTTEPFAIYPEFVQQYCQNFMAQIEESTFQALTAKKAEISFSDYEAENIYSMRAEIESSSIWGAKHEIRMGNDTTLFTGGIARSIDKVLEYGTGGGDYSLTKEQYTAWLKSLFTGNDGSKERILLAGATLIEAIELLRESSKQISGNTSQETYLGVKCTSIVSTFGTLKIVHAPLFDEQGWGDRGLAIDFEHLYKKEFVPLKASEIDLKGSGQKNAKAKVLQEVSCMILRYPDCHAIMRPKA